MRVMCVDDSPSLTTGSCTGLVKWKEYTVHPCPEGVRNGHGPGFIVDGVRPALAGVLIADGATGCDCFLQSRFRPIKEVDVNAMFRCEETVNA